MISYWKYFYHIMKWIFSFLFYFKHLFQLHSEMKLIILVLFSAPVSVRVLSPKSDQEPSISSKTLSSLFCSSVENSSLFSMVMREVGMEEENNSDDPSLWEDALLSASVFYAERIWIKTQRDKNTVKENTWL